MSANKPPAYGVLNNIRSPFFSPKLNVDQFNFAENIKKVIKNHYTPDMISNTGPYKAIVLRVESKSSSTPGSWMDIFKGAERQRELVKIRARIPELHSMLPLPESSDDHAKIDMYPMFIAQDTTLPEPEVNSLVWVDFGNKNNFSDPIYVKPIICAPGSGPSGDASARSAHTNCGGTFASTSPNGSAVAGSSKNLDHVGGKLLPRSISSSKDNKLLKGKRFNQKTVTAWATGAEKLTYSCTSWIGCMNSNGMDDATHENGKRETILCASNTIRFDNPIEMLYYMHDYKEFNGNKDFENRIPGIINRLTKDKRNFILVIPELPWSVGNKKSKENLIAGDVWSGYDNFLKFHRETLATIKETFTEKINLGYVSVVGIGKGGFQAVYGAVKEGNMKDVNPSHITLTEYDEKKLKEITDALPGAKIDLLTKEKIKYKGDKYYGEVVAFVDGVKVPMVPDSTPPPASSGSTNEKGKEKEKNTGGAPTMGNVGTNCVGVVGSGGTTGGNQSGELNKSIDGAVPIKLLWSPFAAGVAPSISQLLAKAKKVDQKWGDLIRKYQGGVPYGLICVRIGHESGGNEKAPPTKCCGETGALQIWMGSKFAKTRNVDDAEGLGLQCKKRLPGFDPFNPEHNFWGGLSDWNNRGSAIYGRVGKYFDKPDENFWGLVNIEMNIGNGAAEFLLKVANPEKGNVLNGLCEWVVATGEGMEQYKKRYGSQTAASVARRILITSYWVLAAQQLTNSSLETASYGTKGFLNFG